MRHTEDVGEDEDFNLQDGESQAEGQRPCRLARQVSQKTYRVAPDQVTVLDAAENDVRVGLVALALPDLKLEQELLRPAEPVFERGGCGGVEADGRAGVEALGDKNGGPVEELDEAT